jgi:ABC-2 type transport system permease protein
VKSDTDPRGSRRLPRGAFAELFKVQARLALRERYIYVGIILPVGLLVVFWAISGVSGTVAGTGLTVLDLWIPTILVICYITLALLTLPQPFARDREIGWLRRVSTTPVPPLWLLTARLLMNLIVAAIVTVVVIVVGGVLFGAPLSVGIMFVGVAILAIAEIYALGLIVAAIAPSQQGGAYIAGGLFYPLLFLSGLWIQPVQVGGVLEQIMWYSPAGAPVRALLYSVFNVTPPYGTLVAMGVYTVIFVLVAVRYFRWE